MDRKIPPEKIKNVCEGLRLSFAFDVKTLLLLTHLYDLSRCTEAE